MSSSELQGDRVELTKKVTRKSLFIILPLALASLFVNWSAGYLKFVGLFGKTDSMTLSIVIGAILGLANLKGLVWGLDSLLGEYKANTKLVFLSLFRLGILFAIIIILAALRLINLLGLLVGMTVVFIILIIEAVKMAREQGKEGDGSA